MSFGAWSSILRQLVIPQDASDAEPRVVIGDDVPQELRDFYLNFSPDFVVILAMIFWTSDTDYWWMALVESPTFPAFTGGSAGLAMGVTHAGTVKETATQYTSPFGLFGFTDVIGDQISMYASATPGSSTSPTLVHVHGDLQVSAGEIWWMSDDGGISRAMFDRDTNTYENFTSSGFAPTNSTNSPSFLFHIPPSGRGKITMGVRADADTADERFKADVEIRESSPGGPVVHSPTTADAQGIEVYYSSHKPSAENWPGWRYLDLPSGRYWAQLQIDTLGTTIDITDQALMYEPLL